MATSPGEEGYSDAQKDTTPSTSSQMSSVAKGALILSIGTFVSRILGWYRERLLLDVYGDSNIASAYKSAFQVPDLLYYLLAGGALSAAFIPIFSAYLAKKQDADAHRIGSSIANMMLVAIAIGTIIEMFTAKYIVMMIAPGYIHHPEVFQLTVDLTRILCFMVFFTALSGLLTGMLNSYHHFLATTLVWNTYNLGIIFGLVYLRKYNWGPHGIYGVALGVIIGAFSMAAIQLPVLLKYGFRYSPVIDWAHEGVKKVLVLFVPVMIAFSLSQINLMNVPLIIVSLLGPPAVTDTQAASRLVLLPLGIFAVAISTAAFPRLAQQLALGETREFRETLVKSMKAILLLTAPATVAMFVLAEPLTFLLWGGGEFGAGGVRAAAYSLLFFVWALLGISVMQIINRAFFSMHQNWVPMLVALGVVAVNIPLSLLLIHTPLRYGGVTLASSLTLFIGCLVLVDLLRRRLGGLGGRELAIMGAKVMLASLLMGVVVYQVARITPLVPRFAYNTASGPLTVEQQRDLRDTRIVPRFPGSAPFIPREKAELGVAATLVVPRGKLLIQVGACAAIGLPLYFLLLRLMGVAEVNTVLARIVGKFRRRTPASA
jgi:putative peptidoglycan lipid II flippase